MRDENEHAERDEAARRREDGITAGQHEARQNAGDESHEQCGGLAETVEQRDRHRRTNDSRRIVVPSQRRPIEGPSW